MRGYLLLLALLCSAFLGVLLPTGAHASSFDVAPISLTLSAKVSSGMLAVTNRGVEPLRFHVTAYSWDQKADGEMVLTPTKDIVFFPAMLTLNPQEARNLRIGTSIKPGAVEKSYRVFVQELPPLALSPDEQASTVRVLTKMGIPVFVEGSSAKPAPGLHGLTFAAQKLTFQVKNAGSAHFRPEKIVVKGKDGSKVIHSQNVDGWYVLAGGIRTYEVTLPIEACDVLKSIDVEMKWEGGSTMASLGNARCTR